VRLFAAVDPPREQLADLDAHVDRDDDRLRFVAVEQWHVTLAFYGEVPDAKVDELTERLARAAARGSTMTLRLAGAGTFPRQPVKARVLWAGLDGDVEALSRLAASCAAAGRRLGLAMEERAFRPHLTLARARRTTADLRQTLSALSAYEGSPWRATTLRLVHSTLGPTPHHHTLQEFPLAPHQA
jgi:RNA 2',3'-cyclic 3'-phosphodiesterase